MSHYKKMLNRVKENIIKCRKTQKESGIKWINDSL